jgi:TnpA family transposase
MPAASRRLLILSAREIEALYGLPRFTEADRALYFEWSPAEQEAIDAVHTFSAALHLALQLGHFKAKAQFFVYEWEAVLDDIRHLLAHHFPDRELADVKPLSKPTRLLQQRTILDLYGSQVCDKTAKADLEQKAQQLARCSTQPLYILRETLQYLANRRIVAPGYTFLQDLVGRTVTEERQRLTQLLDQALTSTVTQRLDDLLQAKEGVYRISTLKQEPRDFSYQALRQEVMRRQVFQPLHEFAQTFLAAADLSNESVKYYAARVPFYTVYKLQRLPAATARLYLVCFAYQRFRQINDHLVEAFIYLVDRYEKEAKQAAKEAAQQALDEADGQLEAAGQVLALFIDPSIADDLPFEAVRAKAFGWLDRERFPQVADYLRRVEFDPVGFEWAYYTTLSLTFKRNLRHVFAELDFAGRVEDAPLLEAVVFLQNLRRQGKSPRQAKPATFPTALIPKKLRGHLFVVPQPKDPRTPQGLDVDRYEFLVYRLLRNALEAGDLYVKNSTEYRRLEDDLISEARWRNPEIVLDEIGAPLLMAPIEETLAVFREALDTRFRSVNARIAQGENQHIKVYPAGRHKRPWTLDYPEPEEPVQPPFYRTLPGVGIADVLWFVANRTGFLKAFTHVLDRYVKQPPDPRYLLADLVALGTHMGLRKMAEVSGLGWPSLTGTARNYLRLETLQAANGAISNGIAGLPLFPYFDIEEVRHSSSDGQRLETQIETFNARHSRKYFGLKKGVTAYTLVANHVPINAKIIGTHEHESHFVFDLLYNNMTEIRPERHSTDTHGTNQVNFWILMVFGYQFAPRYRDLHKKMDTLIGFHPPSHYADDLIKPARQVFEGLIVREWPNIQRLMASLAQKDVTQATLIRKLNSFVRQNQTKKALWELDGLCRTLYILDYIDDVGLRQNVQKALNRGEAYHRFRRAIAYVNGGKFRVKTEAEQHLWNECSRLLANAIIYYNTALLSRIYEQQQAAGDVAALDLIKAISPIAWQHINLFGNLDFNAAASNLDLEALAARYADPEYWRQGWSDDPEDPPLH